MSFRIFGELQIKQHVLRLLALLFSSLEIRNIMIQSCILLIDFFPTILTSPIISLKNLSSSLRATVVIHIF